MRDQMEQRLEELKGEYEAGHVAELETLDGDAAAHRFGQGGGRIGLANVGAKAEEREDLVQRRARALGHVVDLREVLDRLEDELQVENEGRDGADGGVVAGHLAAAKVEDDPDPGASQPFDEREVDGRDADGPHIRFEVALVDGAEAFHVVLLAHEGLDHAKARERLLHMDEDIGDAFPHRRVGAFGRRAEDRSRDGH